MASAIWSRSPTFVIALDGLSTNRLFVTGSTQELEDQCINTILILSGDAVQNANCGHPGMPMGAAAMAFTL
jgi:hypothetical protein